MGTHKRGTQPTLVNEAAQPSEKKVDGNGYKLHLALDKASYARLVWLQGALRATSFGEVLRRAIDAYELFEPEELADSNDKKSEYIVTKSENIDVKHLYILISDEMKVYLDEQKSMFGRAYKETIRRALCVLMQLVRERAKLVAEMNEGECMSNKNGNGINSINPVMLACL